MSWPTTLEAWSRRELLVLSVLGVIGSLAAIAKLLGWVEVVLGIAIVVALGRAARLLVSWRKSQVAGERESAARKSLVRGGRIAPITEIAPIAIGVDAAAQDILPGDEVPQYLPREADKELREALEHAVDEKGPWVVVVAGPSKVGKSRTLFEGLRKTHEAGRKLVLIAPRDGDAVRALLVPDQAPKIKDGRPVVWLDDLEVFLGQDVNLNTLREWRDRTGAIFVATFGGKGRAYVQERHKAKMSVLASEILSQAHQVGLAATSPAELEQLPETVSASDREQIKDYGLAATMVAGPILKAKFESLQEGGEQEAFSGKAIVESAVDWARCGRTDPIADARLRQLWRSYLPKGVDSDDRAYKSGLDWARRPVTGRVSLLQSEGERAYQAYDYVVRLVDGSNSSPPRKEAWEQALADPDPRQAFTVGVSASSYELPDFALRGMKIASTETGSTTAAMATFNIGVLLSLRGEEEKAEEEWEKAADLGWGDGAFNVGIRRRDRGDFKGAKKAWRRGVELNHAGAAFSLGSRLREEGDLEGAAKAWEVSAVQGHMWSASNLALLRAERKEARKASAAWALLKSFGPGKSERDFIFKLGISLANAGALDASEDALRVATGFRHGSAALGFAVMRDEREDPEGALKALQVAFESSSREDRLKAAELRDELEKKYPAVASS